MTGAASAMKRYQCIFRSARVSVVVDVEASDGGEAIARAVKRNRAHFQDAEIWDETGLVRILTIQQRDRSPMND